MPSYPDPAPRSPWKAHAAKRAEALTNNVLGKIFGKLIAVGFAPEEAREGGAWTRILLSWREGRIRYYRVKLYMYIHGGFNAILECTLKVPHAAPPIKI